jgi:hypothetical protein
MAIASTMATTATLSNMVGSVSVNLSKANQ